MGNMGHMMNRIPEVVPSAACVSESGTHDDTIHVRIVAGHEMDALYCKTCGCLGPLPGRGYTTLAVWTPPSGGARAEEFRARELGD